MSKYISLWLKITKQLRPKLQTKDISPAVAEISARSKENVDVI